MEDLSKNHVTNPNEAKSKTAQNENHKIKHFHKKKTLLFYGKIDPLLCYAEGKSSRAGRQPLIG